MERPGWQKAVALAGGAAAAGGLLWYLFSESEHWDEGETKEKGDKDEADTFWAEMKRSGAKWFKVTDTKQFAIGIRAEPNVEAQRTGGNVQFGDVFPVGEVVEDTMSVPSADGPSTEVKQSYLQLIDGRGWVFTHSSRDGRLLAEEIGIDQARVDLEAYMNRPRTQMEDLMMAAEKEMEKNPALREQILNSQATQGMMANPEALLTAAEAYPSVAEALQMRPELREALGKDSADVGAQLRSAMAGASAP